MDKSKFSPRLNYCDLAREGLNNPSGLETYIHANLEPGLIELVKLRASQINGCAYCIDMHTKDARSAGESEQRLYGLNAWREAPYYTARERAALEWTEALTLISQNHAPDEVYERVKAQFCEKELVDLSLTIISINSWNRLAISFRSLPGSYKPDHPASQKLASQPEAMPAV